MFNTNYQDFVNYTTKAFEAIPKTTAEFTTFAGKVKSVIETETKNNTEMFKTYQKSLKGDATPKELAAANKQAAEFIKGAVFTSMLAVPGGVFVAPAIVKQAREHNIHLVPASVAAEFNI